MFLPPKNDNSGKTSLWSIKLYGVAICLGEVMDSLEGRNDGTLQLGYIV